MKYMGKIEGDEQPCPHAVQLQHLRHLSILS